VQTFSDNHAYNESLINFWVLGPGWGQALDCVDSTDYVWWAL